jgi:hypothetical protein
MKKKWCYIFLLIGFSFGFFHPDANDSGFDLVLITMRLAFSVPFAAVFYLIGLIIDYVINSDSKVRKCPLCKSSLMSNATECIFCGENLSSVLQTTSENYLHSGIYESEKYSGLSCIFFPNGECAIEISNNNFRLYETKNDLFKSISSFGISSKFSNSGFLRLIKIKS